MPDPAMEKTELQALLQRWRQLQSESEPCPADAYHNLARMALGLGEPLLAYDIASAGLAVHPDDVALRQKTALALFRSKAAERALEVLQTLIDEGHRDEETLGLMGRFHKDLAERALGEDRRRHLEEAYTAYLQAYRETSGYWTAINAATMARILGRRDEAVDLALEVDRQCQDLLGSPAGNHEDPYWLQATRAEAALIREEWDRAADLYAQASRLAGSRYGDLASTRRNARLLLEALGAGAGIREKIERSFTMPRIVVFAGHMVDRPDRETPRFPVHLEREVSRAIREHLKHLNARYFFASAACGSDICFLEAALETGGEVHVVLPYDEDQFLEDSVDIAAGGAWAARFLRVLKRATTVITASREPLAGGGISYEYSNKLLTGLAKIKAYQLDAELVPLAVWDGKEGDGPGGTASIVKLWEEDPALMRRLRIIDLTELLERCPEPQPPSQTDAGAPVNMEGFVPELKTMLFTDARHFSRLSESQVILFFRHFMGAVKPLLERYRYDLLESMGDGLYMVFPNARDAGLFALELCELVNRTDWSAVGLPRDMSIRLGLHAGPVFAFTHPLTNQRNFVGTHVSRTARIEPVTPPGHIYASEEFAALAAVENVAEFACDYVGQTTLAKQYGTIPAYHVRRAG